MEWILVAFGFKHFICDFPLQTSYMFLNKGKYGHPGGVLHAAIHALGTLILCLLFGLPYWFMAIDGLVHYHIDWSKNRLNSRYALTPDNTYFWWLFGADQLAHYLTYIALISLL